MKSITVRTSPSLALIKYWGKYDREENLPATSSLAVTLDGLYTTTTITFAEKQDEVLIDDTPVPVSRYTGFFDRIRRATGTAAFFRAASSNNFPTAAGLASSSSGFAALAMAAVELSGGGLTLSELSSLARYGSASAARSLFGGFTLLEQRQPHASPFLPASHWPELCLLVVIVAAGAKQTSSRQAMEACRLHSPYYPAWVEDSQRVFQEAKAALQQRNLEKLGTLMGLSYLRMFAAMLATAPPVVYWLPASIALIHLCRKLRQQGLGAWETMDAGPQLKIFCLTEHKAGIKHSLRQELPDLTILESRAGDGNWKLPVFSAVSRSSGRQLSLARLRQPRFLPPLWLPAGKIPVKPAGFSRDA